MSGSTTEVENQNPDPGEQQPVIQSEPAVQPGEGEGSIPSPGSPPPQVEQPGQQPDWRDRRIATLTRRLRELQERGQPGPQVQQPDNQARHQPAEQALIEQRARELSIIQDFNRRCDETALVGRSQFGETEFNGRIQNLQKLSDPTDPNSVQAYNSLLMAALEAGDSARLLFELGADLNEAQKILGMSPTRMAVEMTKRAARPPVQTSNATRPITPLGGRPASHERIEADDPDRSDHLSTAEWMRRREAQIADRLKASRGQ